MSGEDSLEHLSSLSRSLLCNRANCVLWTCRGLCLLNCLVRCWEPCQESFNSFSPSAVSRTSSLSPGRHPVTPGQLKLFSYLWRPYKDPAEPFRRSFKELQIYLMTGVLSLWRTLEAPLHWAMHDTSSTTLCLPLWTSKPPQWPEEPLIGTSSTSGALWGNIWECGGSSHQRRWIISSEPWVNFHTVSYLLCPEIISLQSTPSEECLHGNEGGDDNTHKHRRRCWGKSPSHHTFSCSDDREQPVPGVQKGRADLQTARWWGHSGSWISDSLLLS